MDLENVRHQDPVNADEARTGGSTRGTQEAQVETGG